ncbi:alpha/beta hydrolase [Pseudomonas sp. NPDC088444]|uniref:alpha/beta hydrolase n=1 Tax=Pseudomonas sp. NPDC088444 TaxID=3364456 RepID=UPI00384B5433
MNRRDFIVMSSLAILSARAAFAQAGIFQIGNQKIALWEGKPPGGGGPRGTENFDGKGALSNVTHPSLEIFKPERPNGKAVLIAAGGGYKRIEQGTEAIPAAQWLSSIGYTAYILSYRLPGEGWNDGAIVSLQDAQRALRLVRSREKHVSVLGFSAGGHLLGMAVNQTGFQSYKPTDDIDAIPARAEAAALIYPVITLERPYTHTSTHKILVGPHSSAEDEARWSVQNMVTNRTPPMFLVQAEDDPISDPQNTLIMASVCERAGVPVEMHRYSSGGHGFGLGRAGTPTVKWPSHYQVWLDSHA